jgi:hypothetical protein
MPVESIDSATSRLSLSLPTELFRQLDVMVAERGLRNRSQMMAELIRHELASYGARERPDDMVAGTMTLIYRAESGEVRHAIALTQGEYPHRSHLFAARLSRRRPVARSPVRPRPRQTPQCAVRRIAVGSRRAAVAPRHDDRPAAAAVRAWWP